MLLGSVVVTTFISAMKLDRFFSFSAFAILTNVVVQAFVGIILRLSYQPTVARAYDSVTALRSQPFGLFLASFHYWASALLLLQTAIHVFAMLFAGHYKSNPRAWYAGIGVALVSFGLQLSGNMLPFDRHGVETAVVESGIAGSVPLIGSTAHSFFLAGHGFGQPTLSLWLLGHSWILGIAALVFASLLYVLTQRGLSQPHRALSTFVPAFLPVLAVAVLSIFVHGPRGNAATPDDFTSFGARVSWYTWPLHGMLSMANKLGAGLGWVGSALWPGLTLAFFLLLPVLARRFQPQALRAVAFVFLAPFVLAPFMYGGPVASLTGNRDPEVKQDPVASSPQKSTQKFDPAVLLAGRNLFNSSGCAGCHGTDGANGDAGPNLQKVFQKHAEVDYYERYVREPKSVDPESTMPPFTSLPAEDLTKIATWLASPK